MSAVLDIPQNQLSWVRLTQAASDKHIFLLSKHGRRQHAEGAFGGKVIADATNQMKPDLRLPLLQKARK